MKQAIAEYVPGDKKAKISDKNVNDLYMNVASAYFYLDNFEMARNWIKDAMTIEKSEHVEKSMLRQIDAQEVVYNLNVKREAEKQL